MTDIKHQLETFCSGFDTAVPPIDIGRTLMTSTLDTRQEPGTKWWRRPAITVTAAAVVTLLVMGGGATMLLGDGGGDGDVVASGDSSTTTHAPTTTLAPEVTTIAPGAGPDPAEPAMTWVRVADQAAFAAGNLLAVAEGGSGLIASGYVETSPFPNLAYAPGFWISSDGVTWERITEASAGVVYADADLIVSLGFDEATQLSLSDSLAGCAGGAATATAAISIDGLEWTRVAQDAEAFCPSDLAVPFVSIEGITRLGDTYVAVGGMLSGSYAQPAAGAVEDALVWVSTDGLTWERVEDPSLSATDADGNHLDMTTVISTGDRIIAAGNAGVEGCAGCTRPAMWASDDGLTWERLPDADLDITTLTGSKATFYRFLGTPADGFIAIGWGDEVQIWTSSDGLSWIRGPGTTGDGFGSGVPVDAIFVDEGILAVGTSANGAAMWLSEDDGATWSEVTPTFDGDTGVINAAFATPDGIVAVGTIGSPTGLTGAAWVGTFDD